VGFTGLLHRCIIRGQGIEGWVRRRENYMHWASLMIDEVSLEEVNRRDSPVGPVLSNHSFPPRPSP